MSYKNNLRMGFLTSASLLFLLSACGGSGGTGDSAGPAIPPPPPPPPPPKSFQEMAEKKIDFNFIAPIGVIANTTGQKLEDQGFLHPADNTHFTYGLESGEFDVRQLHPNSKESFSALSLNVARSNDAFDIYETSDASFALMNPGKDVSGYEYVSLLLSLDSGHDNYRGITTRTLMSALTFGFNTAPQTLPTAGEANFLGTLVGHASITNGEFGVVDGPASITVDFGEGLVHGQFGGRTSSQILGELRFTSLLTDAVGHFADIVFSAPLDRDTATFSGAGLFSALDLGHPNTDIAVQGGFYGPSGDNGPPEVGGTITVAHDDFGIVAAFVAKQGGDARGIAFQGLTPYIYDIYDPDNVHRYYGTSQAPEQMPADFISRELLHYTYGANLPYGYRGKLNINPLYDLAAHYRMDLSSGESLAFQVSASESNPDSFSPGILTIDSEDVDRFGVHDIRFGSLTWLYDAPENSHKSVSGFGDNFFYLGIPLQADLLPITGTASFEGGASGQFHVRMPLEDGITPQAPTYDFDSKIVMEINFAHGTLLTTFSDYTIPSSMLDYIDPSERNAFTLKATMYSPLNFFTNSQFDDQQNGSIEGRIYSSADNMEVGGKFYYAFDMIGISTYRNTNLIAHGFFGASQTEFTETGEPPLEPSGMANNLIDGLLTRTNGFSGTKEDILSFIESVVKDDPKGISFGGRSKNGVDMAVGLRANSSSFHYSSATHTQISIDAKELRETDDSGDYRLTITSADIAAGTSNDSLTVIKSQTPTRGDIAVAFSNPGSDAFGLDYAGFGFWALEEPTKAISVGGAIYGTPTFENSALPQTGTANYHGKALAIVTSLSNSTDETYADTYGTIIGDSSIDVDFSKAEVNLSLSNLELHVAEQDTTFDLPDLSGTGTWTDGAFEGFFGEPPEEGSSTPNRFIGHFYGPASLTPPEVAGIWLNIFKNPADATRYISAFGVFTGKQ